MKNILRKIPWNLETTILAAFAGILAVLLTTSAASLVTLRETLHSKSDDTSSYVNALVEVEKIRSLIEVKASDARGYFLLGSKALLDEHAQLKTEFATKIAAFEKDHPLPKIPEIMKRLSELEAQQQEAFEQGVQYREKKTESKIVGQFFQSKLMPIRKGMNAALDEIPPIVKQEIDRVKAEAGDVIPRVEAQIVSGASSFTVVTIFLVAGLMLLILRLLFQRSRYRNERLRIFDGAKKAQLARDEMMVAIATDIKEPLDEMARSVDTIETATDPSAVNAAIEKIKVTIGAIENVVQNIVDKAKAEEGNIALRLEQLGVNEFLNDARFMLEPMAKRNDVRLQVDLGNPPVLAFFDRERLLRVLANLVSNAVKFSPKHSKVIIKAKSDRQFAYISVIDSGVGIPAGQQTAVLEDHWQAPKTADQGAGVGLSVAKTIIEAHGGTLKVESAPRSGSTFIVSIPLRRPAGAVLVKPKTTIKSAGVQDPHVNN